MPRNWRHRSIRRRILRTAEERDMPTARVQFVTTADGQELAVMSRAEYDRLAAAAEMDIVEDTVTPTGIPVSAPRGPA